MHHHDLLLYGIGIGAFIIVAAILYCLYKCTDRVSSSMASRRESRASTYSTSIKKQHEVMPLVVSDHPNLTKKFVRKF
uniref:Uncharacterized protein n=1 Tax=Plectus sambesii TaxID=2011161 RepID=A0A914VQM3_9BILA